MKNMKIISAVILLASIYLTLAKPPRECMVPGDSRKCCPNWPKIINETQIHECMRETFEGRKQFVCAFECYTNATKINVNGKINKDNAVSSMISMLKPEFAEWKPILTKGIEKCVHDANNDTYLTLDKEESSSEEDESREKCSKRSGYFLACVGGQMFQNCPTDVWTNTTKCGEYKAIVQKCNVYLPPHHKHHHHHHHHHPGGNDTNKSV